MIYIGVTGHRIIKEEDTLEAGIKESLARIEQRFPGQAWTVLSSLAEGADQMVARLVIERQPMATLIVPLPFPEEEYLRDFSNAESRQVFWRLFGIARQVIYCQQLPTHEDSYVAAGEYICEHCDVLIALWDGKAARGKGGTADIVQQARRHRLPLIWVYCINQAKTDELDSHDINQGLVRYERFFPASENKNT